ncbi:MAG: hypothetical protein FWF97_04460 [Alphaproteobacteria bacterium]|nr:hypothetical protein [Alphaproteobacteria bacterium]
MSIRKIIFYSFTLLLFYSLTLASAHAASTTFYKLGGSGTISNLIFAHNGAVCSGTACSSTTACCITGVSGTSTGTANVAITPAGNAINTPGVSLLTRYGSTYLWPPLYMPGTRTIPAPPGNPSGGTAPLMGVVAAPQQQGIWCNNVPYGNVASSMCFPGGTGGKVTGQFSGGVYAVWSCNGGFYAPPRPATPIADHDTCLPVEAGYYSPFRELDRYPCPVNHYCPAAEEICPILTGSVAASMVPNKPGCTTVSSATTGTAAAPTFQPVACPSTEVNCAAAPIPCPSPWTLSDGLQDAVTDCYYRYDPGCPLPNFPHATVVEGRVYNPGGNPQVVCEIKACETGYAVIDGQCVLGCPAGKYMSAPNTCTDCPAGRYCVGGYVMPEDCPSTHPNSLPANPMEELCYENCDPLMFPNSTAITGYDYHDFPSTCAASACQTNYTVRDGQCVLACAAGQYNNGGVCAQCPAGYYCPANEPQPLLCRFGNFCPAGSSSESECPLTHPNSQPGATANTLCYVVANCSAANAATSEQRNFYNNAGANQCVALTCIPGYQVVNWQCVSETNLTIATLNKNGGTGTLLGVVGGGGVTLNCDNQMCDLPALTPLTRANSVFNYSSDGTNYPNGRWCTQADGGGTCYTGGQSHSFTGISTITLYAMWSCAGGYYNNTATTCGAVGSGYFSPNYANNRTQCQAGYYCSGTTAAVQQPCPGAFPDSAAGSTSSMMCRRPCPELPGVDTMVPGGFEYQGLPSTCEAASCIANWTLEDGVCIPPDASCPPGYYFDSYCKDCPPGSYCVGEEEPAVPCPQEFPSSEVRNPSIDECFSPCVPSNYNAVLMMTGREYYDDNLSTCCALVCMNGYSLDNCRCGVSQCPAGQFLNDQVCDTCGVGRWYNGTPGSGCTPVGSEYYSPVNDARKYECPSNTLSGGDGTYAASISDCTVFKTLKVDDGNDLVQVIMRTAKITTPSLHVYDGSKLYYGNLSLSAPASGQALKINNGTTVYYVQDNAYSQ